MGPNTLIHPSPHPLHPWPRHIHLTLTHFTHDPPILTHTHPLNPFTHGPKHSHTPIPTPPSHDASSLFVMFCDSSKWFVVVRHGLWCFMVVCHGSWCFSVMVRHGSSWFVMFLCHGFVMVCHGSWCFTVMVSSWFVMVHDVSLSWFRHGLSWFVMFHCHGFVMVRDVLFSKILQKKVMWPSIQPIRVSNSLSNLIFDETSYFPLSI